MYARMARVPFWHPSNLAIVMLGQTPMSPFDLVCCLVWIYKKSMKSIDANSPKIIPIYASLSVNHTRSCFNMFDHCLQAEDEAVNILSKLTKVFLTDPISTLAHLGKG